CRPFALGASRGAIVRHELQSMGKEQGQKETRMMMNAATAARKIGGNCRGALAAAGLTALVVALGCSCGESNAAVNTDVAIVPDANVVLKADIQGMQEAPIHAKMEAIRDAEESSLPTKE
ncbi:MAG: hypothetical protein R6U00_10170, partial [Prochlorococcaceae cyanobacterium]